MITNYKKFNPSLKIVEKLPGRILTQPSDASTTSSDDNADGNLICRVHDIITSDAHQYTVLDLLGTGTFGQVFRCQIMKTGELVAVKVVKGKPAYRTQGLLEVKIAKLLNTVGDPEDKHHIVRILDSFEYKGHVCIVFELLGCSLLDLLTQNQFRGLPLSTVQRYAKQILMSLVVLQDASVIHCDLKPENILLINKNKRAEKKKERLEISSAATPGAAGSSSASSSSLLSAQLRGTTTTSTSSASALPSQSKGKGDSSTSSTIGDLKLIDFGSACFEGKTMYSYIQSRFYRSPEVLLGIPYNGAIDIWSLGCVCAEMFVGLPIFPGVSQHNQLSRIVDMLGPIPDFLVRQGKNGPKFFIQDTTVPSQFPYPGFGPVPVRSFQTLNSMMPPILYDPYRQHPSLHLHPTQQPPQQQQHPSYRLKTAEEFAFENQTTVPTFKKYLKYDHLDDIILRCPSAKKSKLTTLQKNEEMAKRKYFLDFLKGLFNLNPFDRWTARQALNHPFIRDFERIGLQQQLPRQEPGEGVSTQGSAGLTHSPDHLTQRNNSVETANHISSNSFFGSDEVFSVTIPMHQQQQLEDQKQQQGRQQEQENHQPLASSSADELVVTISPSQQQKSLLVTSPSPLLPYVPPEDPVQHTRFQQFQQKLLGTSSSAATAAAAVNTTVPPAVAVSSKEIDKSGDRNFRLLKKSDRRESEPIGLNSRRDDLKRNAPAASAIPVPAPPLPPPSQSEQLASSVSSVASSFFWPLFGQQPSTSMVLSPQSQTQAQQLSPEKQTQDHKRRYFEPPHGTNSGAPLVAAAAYHPSQSAESHQQLHHQQQHHMHHYPSSHWNAHVQVAQGYGGGPPLQAHHSPNRSQMPPSSYSQSTHQGSPQSSQRMDPLLHMEAGTGGIPIPSYNHTTTTNWNQSNNLASSYSHASSYSSVYPSSLGGLGNMSGVNDFGQALTRADLDQSKYLQSYAQQSPPSYSPLSYSPGGLLGSSSSSYLSSSPNMRGGSYLNSALSPQQQQATSSPGGMASARVQRRPSDAAANHEASSQFHHRYEMSGAAAGSHYSSSPSQSHLYPHSGGHNHPRGITGGGSGGYPSPYGDSERQLCHSHGHHGGSPNHHYHHPPPQHHLPRENAQHYHPPHVSSSRSQGQGHGYGQGQVHGRPHHQQQHHHCPPQQQQHYYHHNQQDQSNRNSSSGSGEGSPETSYPPHPHNMKSPQQPPMVSALTAALVQASLVPPSTSSSSLPPPSQLYPHQYPTHSDTQQHQPSQHH
jgi:serine/threonine protein kinase